MPHSIGDVIRMAGHLLEHNPTTGAPYKRINGRECYCFFGALCVVAEVLKVQGDILGDAMRVTGMGCTFVDKWEGLGVTDEDRLKIAKRMQQYVG